MGSMGHPAAHTPNLDGLTARGVLFRNTYCNNPICCPSRASMWSGLYTFHCEGWNNYKGLEPNAPTFRTHLDAAGYLTETCGKTDYLSGGELAVTHTRAFAVDFSGKSGAPCLVVVVDKLAGTEKYTTFAQYNLPRQEQVISRTQVAQEGSGLALPRA